MAIENIDIEDLGVNGPSFYAVLFGGATFDVRAYGAVCDGVTDDTAAVQAAIAAANVRALAGFSAVLRFPAGVCNVTTASGLTQLKRGVRIQGDREYGSYIRMTSTFVGDLFSWSESWYSNDSADADEFFPTVTKAGPGVRDMTIIGDRGAAGQQNAIMLYDRCDAFSLDNVSCFRVPGRVLGSGILQNASQAYLRESKITNFRTSGCGASGVAVVEFNTVGTGDSTNSIDCYGWNMYGSYGPGLIIRNANNAGTNPFIRDMKWFGLRIEGFEGSSPDSGADLIQIGDAVAEGGIHNIDMIGLKLISPPTGKHALHTLAPNNTAGNNIYNCLFQGSIGAGGGGGLNILAGRSSRFNFREIATSGTHVTVGPAANGVGTQITIDGNGAESAFTYSIDATSTTRVRTPLMAFGDPSANPVTASVAANFSATKYQGFVKGSALRYMPIVDAVW